MLLLALTTATLLTVRCQAVQLQGGPASKLLPSTCTGEECIRLLDHIHSSSSCGHPPYVFMTCRTDETNHLYSMSCHRDQGGCNLTFKNPEIALQESIPDPSSPEQNLLRIMLSHGTDKATRHHYSPLYQKYLGHLSRQDAKPFTFVEVGFAWGASARAWSKFFPSADIHEMEITCDDWNHFATQDIDGTSGPHRRLRFCNLHCGDATDEDFLQEALRNVSAPLVAVDDGGHGEAETRRFFRQMWPRLRHSGMLFVEDLAESYAVPRGFVETTLKPVMRDLVGVGSDMPELSDMFADLEHIECIEQLCLFQKE